jgi:hypothetical protein
MWRAGSPSSTTMYESVCMIPTADMTTRPSKVRLDPHDPVPGTVTWTTPGRHTHTTASPNTGQECRDGR